jgi:large subunit ribosomal protein L32
MAEPKKKLTRTRSGNRRSHRRLTVVKASKCQNCGAPVVPHRICKTCGFYKGKQVIDIR